MYLTDMSKIYSYQATSVNVVQPTAVEMTYNQPNKNQLTLITCDYTAERGRVAMQGDLKQVYTWHDAPKFAIHLVTQMSGTKVKQYKHDWRPLMAVNFFISHDLQVV